MEDTYQMSHNACSVLLDGGHKVIIRLGFLKIGQTPKWYFVATSQDGKYSFTSAIFTSSTLAIRDILEFARVINGLISVCKYMKPIEYLEELFADVIYIQLR